VDMEPQFQTELSGPSITNGSVAIPGPGQPTGPTGMNPWGYPEPTVGGMRLGPRRPAQKDSSLREVERDVILRTLELCDGNRTHASERLGISIRTLRNRLREYRDQGVEIPQPGAPGKRNKVNEEPIKVA